MTQMEPVKDTNRQVRRPSNRFQFVDGTQNFHDLGGLSLHRSQILRDVSDAGYGSGTLRLGRKISSAFCIGEFKNNFVSIHLLISKPAQHHIPSQPGSAQDWSPPGYGAGLS